MSVKHTELPWRVTSENNFTVRAASSRGQPIASMWLNGSDPEANAQLIVTAVNTYPVVTELVKAIKAARNELMMLGDPGSSAERIVDQIDAALAKFNALSAEKDQ